MSSPMMLPGARVHIVGIGGAGMSGVARLLAERGCVVSGCDRAASAALDDLAADGVAVAVGHDTRHVDGVDLVLWSPAVAADHPERVAAAAHATTSWDRPTFLQWLCRERAVVAIAGTHGKTTATSMMAHVWAAAGRDAGRLLGADVPGVGRNGHWGSGDLLLELDESYGTFALAAPYGLGIVNVEADHLDHYGDVAHLEEAFAQLAARATGFVVVATDDPGAARVASHHATAVTVGRATTCDWRITDERVWPAGAAFSLTHGDVGHAITLQVTGRHNVTNAALVAVVGAHHGVAWDAIAQGLAAFTGAPRRFTRRGQWRGVPVIEDYAHLPGEIAATLATLFDVGYQRPLVVFQPHRVTRTVALGEELGHALAKGGTVIVTDIYTAGEPNPDGVRGTLVADAVTRAGGAVTYVANLSDLAGHLDPSHHDVVIFLGAGDVATIIDALPGGVS